MLYYIRSIAKVTATDGEAGGCNKLDKRDGCI